MKTAQFSSLGNDLTWQYFDDADGLIFWHGYNDRNWWINVAHTDQARQRIGSKTGRVFEIDFHTRVVSIQIKEQQ